MQPKCIGLLIYWMQHMNNGWSVFASLLEFAVQCKKAAYLKKDSVSFDKKVSMKDYFNVQYNHTIRFILWRGFIWKCNRLLQTYRKGKLDAKIACPFSGRNIKAKLGVLTIQFEDWLFVCFALGWQFKWDAFTMLSMHFAVFFKGSRAAVASNAQKTRDHNVGINSTYCLLALSTCCCLLAANDRHQW